MQNKKPNLQESLPLLVSTMIEGEDHYLTDETMETVFNIAQDELARARANGLGPKRIKKNGALVYSARSVNNWLIEQEYFSLLGVPKIFPRALFPYDLSESRMKLLYEKTKEEDAKWFA